MLPTEMPAEGPVSTRRPLCAAISLTLAVAAVPLAVHAGEPAQLPRIAVQANEEAAADTIKIDKASSPKLTQPLVDTPQTITIVSKEVLQQQGAATLTEALRNTPGITLLAGEGGGASGTAGDSIFMRGFDTQGSIFVDNIRDLGAISRDVFNTEQVEIAKGPAGADNGRGATSGYVNMVTKVPQADDFIGGNVSYGDNERKRITFDVNEGFGNGTAVRLNVLWQDGGVAGRDVVQRDSWGVAPSIAFGLNTSTRIYAYYQHVEQDNTPDYGVPTVGMEGYYNLALATAGINPPRPDRDNFYGLKSDYEDVEVDMFTARLEHDLTDNITIRNISRYGQSERHAVTSAVLAGIVAPSATATYPSVVVTADPSTWLATRASPRQANFRENDILTNQTNFTADWTTGAVKHSVSGGIEFIYEKQTTTGYTGTGSSTVPPATVAATSLWNPDPNSPLTGFALTPTGASTKGETTTTAVYLSDTLSFAERWQVNGSLRWERFDTDYVSVPATATPPAAATTATAKDNLLSWKAGVLFKPTDFSSVYLSYANSLKPPGGDNFTLSTADNNINNPSMDPQEATNLELGTKWDLLGSRLALTAAIYRSENKNELVQSDPADPTVFIQYGKKRVEGVELGAVGQITENWQITAGLATMDAEVLEGTATQSGAIIQWSPKLTGNIWTTYRLPIGLTIGGGVRYVDTQMRSTNNSIDLTTTNMGELPDYYVFDAMASYDITRSVGLQLNVYNLADELYMASVNNNGNRYMPGAPRSFQLTANFRF